MLAAGLGLGLVVGLGLVGLTSTLVAYLHVGSERLLAGFDALSRVPRTRAPEESADYAFTRILKGFQQILKLLGVS